MFHKCTEDVHKVYILDKVFFIKYSETNVVRSLSLSQMHLGLSSIKQRRTTRYVWVRLYMIFSAGGVQSICLSVSSQIN